MMRTRFARLVGMPRTMRFSSTQTTQSTQSTQSTQTPIQESKVIQQYNGWKFARDVVFAFSAVSIVSVVAGCLVAPKLVQESFNGIRTIEESDSERGNSLFFRFNIKKTKKTE